MDLIMYGLSIIVIICMILIWFTSTYNRFQDYIIRINEAESNIDTILRKRFDLLDKSGSVIKASINNDQEILSIIDKIRSRKLSNFDLDRILYQAINEFDTYKQKYDFLATNESFVRINNGILESESEIASYRKYYNDIITDYNKMVKSFPSLLVAKLTKCKIRAYYDGKNMTDEEINDFKL